MAQKLYVEIYNKLKDDILSGRLAAGSRMLSKRRFARARGVSVITVETAYGLLCDEGYLESRPRSGYFVAALPDAPRRRPKPGESPIPPAPSDKLDLSRGNIPAEAFPFTPWARIMRRRLKDCVSDTGLCGALELRRAICEYLYRAKGVVADPENTVVGAGTDHLYNLIIQLFGRDTVFAAENPGYLQFFRVCEVSGATCLPLEIDSKGVTPAALKNTAASVVHLTPSHHFPTGRVMDAARRLEILNWVRSGENRYVIEDDYDSEFSFRTKPVEPLHALDSDGRVIYMNTFSKTLAPSMRISYMILPPALMERFRSRLGFYSCSVPAPEQYTLAQFISEGHFERHIYTLGRYYKKKRDRVIALLRSSAFGDKLVITEEKAGLHFLVKIGAPVTEKNIRTLLDRAGVKIKFLSDYCLNPDPDAPPAAIISYSSLEEADLESALEKISSAINNG